MSINEEYLDNLDDDQDDNFDDSEFKDPCGDTLEKVEKEFELDCVRKKILICRLRSLDSRKLYSTLGKMIQDLHMQTLQYDLIFRTNIARKGDIRTRFEVDGSIVTERSFRKMIEMLEGEKYQERMKIKQFNHQLEYLKKQEKNIEDILKVKYRILESDLKKKSTDIEYFFDSLDD